MPVASSAATSPSLPPSFNPRTPVFNRPRRPSVTVARATGTAVVHTQPSVIVEGISLCTAVPHVPPCCAHMRAHVYEGRCRYRWYTGTDADLLWAISGLTLYRLLYHLYRPHPQIT